MIRPALIFAVTVALSAASSASCSVTECDCATTGLTVVLRGLRPADVTTFTATGACGPLPSPLCDPNRNTSCTQSAGWEVFLTPGSAGTCKIHVALKDGEVFDDTVVVTEASGCCAGFFPDHEVHFDAGATLGDAGAHD